MSVSTRSDQQLYREVALHAFGWLCAANLVGLTLALMLLMPSLNNVLAPFTYGRLVPIHLNGTLYGWCMIPLIGLLFSWYFNRGSRTGLARLSLHIWTIAIGVGCLSWAFGLTSGKLFMEWRGSARWLLSANMLVLAAALLIQMLREPDTASLRAAAKWGLWLALLPIPFVMYVVADPSHFPSVNPDSGGATGGNLLISSLGLVTIMWCTPFLLGLSHRLSRRFIIAYLGFQVLHYILFAVIGHGDQTHRQISQVVGLASLVMWAPLMIRHFRGFAWPSEARPWLWSFALWGVFLVVTANVMFAPGLLEKWKFTNFLVGHTHAAMAGMLSSFNLLILAVLTSGTGTGRIIGSGGLALAWNAGVALHVVTLKIFGTMEGSNPGWLYTQPGITASAYTVRLASGLLMFAVSALWLSKILEAEGDGSCDEAC